MTPLDFLRAADAAYLDPNESIPRGWKLLLPYRETASGYLGAAYQLPNGNIIIAHAGTHTIAGRRWDDLVADGAIVAHQPPDQWRDAEKFVEEVEKIAGGHKIYQTGHSLGGAIAQMSAYKHGHQATVFESPGVAQMIQNGEIGKKGDYNPAESIEIYNMRGSLISEYGKQIADVQHFDLFLPDDVPSKLNVVANIAAMHPLNNFYSCFDKQGNVFKNLGNPEYLDQLLHEKWEQNEVIGIRRMHGDSDEVTLQDKFKTFENFRTDYLNRHYEDLKNADFPTSSPLPDDLDDYLATARQNHPDKNPDQDWLLNILQTKLDRLLQTVQAI